MSQTPVSSTPNTQGKSPAPSIANRGSVRRALFWFAMPVLGEQLLNTAVGLVDVFLAGTISVHATSAIGLAAYVGWLMSMLFMLVGTGATALVARMTGAGKHADANLFANQSLGLAAGLGVAGFAFIWLLAPTLATLQSMSPETSAVVVHYLRFDAIGHLFTSFTLIGAAAMRGVGDMRTPFKILTVVNITNIVTSYALVFGLGPIPAIGINGIVIGTVFGRFIGGLLTLMTLRRGRGGLKLVPNLMKPVRESVRRILRIGGPAALDGLIMWSGHFAFLMLIGQLDAGSAGNAYYAAHIIGIRVEALTYLPAVAFGAAAATMVGQALGAGDAERARRAGHEAVLQCGLLGAALTGFYYFGADAIFRWMQQTDDVVRIAGPPALRMAAFFQVFLTTAIIYVNALRGAGDTRYPLIITFVSVYVVRLPAGYLLGITMELGLMGAWMAMCGDMTIRGVLATMRFVRGRWIDTTV